MAHRFSDHKFKREEIVVLEGSLEVFLENINNKAKCKARVNEMEIITLAPGLAHALKTGCRARYLEFTNMAFDPKNPKKDIFDYVLIENNL